MAEGGDLNYKEVASCVPIGVLQFSSVHMFLYLMQYYGHYSCQPLLPPHIPNTGSNPGNNTTSKQTVLPDTAKNEDMSGDHCPIYIYIYLLPYIYL